VLNLRGLGFGVWESRFGAWGLGLGVWDLRLAQLCETKGVLFLVGVKARQTVFRTFG
jgi:hypothetical protein